MQDLFARVILSIFTNPGDENIGALVAQYGAEETLEKLKTGLISKSLARKLNSVDFETEFKKVLYRTESANAYLITPNEKSWPKQLADLDFYMPHCLWVKGQLEADNSRSISIVGSRAATRFGEQTAGKLAAQLSSESFAVISGAAFGIDAAAHRGALANGGKTIAVLACGIDLAYPSAHTSLINKISKSGAVISELPPGTPALKQNFLTRNRLIAALGNQVVLVEAAMRSGSLSTANWASCIGRDVWAVQGPVNNPTSRGTLEGIRNGSFRHLQNVQDLISNIKV